MKIKPSLKLVNNQKNYPDGEEVGMWGLGGVKVIRKLK